jgi:hypothetical protein
VVVAQVLRVLPSFTSVVQIIVDEKEQSMPIEQRDPVSKRIASPDQDVKELASSFGNDLASAKGRDGGRNVVICRLAISGISRTDGVARPATDRVFCAMTGERPGNPDGIEAGREGSVYCTGPRGI